MQKWGLFTTGLLAGLCIVLLVLLVVQDRESNQAFAQTSSGGAGEMLIMGTGGAQTNFTDIVWILTKQKAPPLMPGADPKDIVSQKGTRTILACYQIMRGGQFIKLIAVRDISFDLDLPEYKNDAPHVADIVKELRKQQKTPKKK